MRPAIAFVILSAPLLLVAGTAAAARVHQYGTEEKAQQHCPKDSVVWGSGRGTFYPKGSPNYGTTPGRWYVCKREALRAGWREADD
jgi:hypothetical protein